MPIPVLLNVELVALFLRKETNMRRNLRALPELASWNMDFTLPAGYKWVPAGKTKLGETDQHGQTVVATFEEEQLHPEDDDRWIWMPHDVTRAATEEEIAQHQARKEKAGRKKEILAELKNLLSSCPAPSTKPKPVKKILDTAWTELFLSATGVYYYETRKGSHYSEDATIMDLAKEVAADA